MTPSYHTALIGGPRNNFLLAASISVASLLALGLMAVTMGGSGGPGAKPSSGRRKHSRRRIQKTFIRGLYNLGNTCFLNSTLQSLASLPAFNEYVDACATLLMDSVNQASANITADAAIIFRLKDVLGQLKPQGRRVPAYSPSGLIGSLSKKGKWMSSRNEQDAQELFQLVSSTLQATRREMGASLFNSGFLSQNAPIESSIISTASSSTNHTNNPHIPNPLQGMAASRISCVKCGYTAAIRHFTFDNLSLTVPRKHKTTVEESLSVYTVIDHLDDFKCRHCTLSATLVQIKWDMAQHTADLDKLWDSPKRAKRLAETIKTLTEQQDRLEHALANNPEDDLKGIELVSPQPGMSTKQTMIARTPRVLALHCRAHIHAERRCTQKLGQCPLQPLLDISPFTTTGHITTSASKPISGPAVAMSQDNSEWLAYAQRNNCLYRLSAVVVHAGNHNSGHYSAYRRVRPAAGDESGDEKADEGVSANEKNNNNVSKQSLLDDGSIWFMASDTQTIEVSESTVMSSGDAYLLFYERL
ncbi:hypothetical protein BX661DRAFT_186169 [Kickxella alabastrina]|uniref:uncharacterized protein n=1 Tax=Kickxella alabastrina TaxID=61397 RepID=UPI00221EA242|nr:uncharacterized protein BX661DRAFT_186169 [Kickxella alabastrina]KAI7823647.1 hypothetical protein BX661DRAFT_186169 [Kickxella alabastrina]